MAWISQNDFTALKQERVIVGRVGSETSLNGQRSNRRADRIESRAVHQSKTWVPGSQPAQQRDKTRSKECNAGNWCCRKFPVPNQSSPQEWENQNGTRN